MLPKFVCLTFCALGLINLVAIEGKINEEVNATENQTITDPVFEKEARSEVFVLQNGTWSKSVVKKGVSVKAVLAGIDKEALQTLTGLKIYVINYAPVTFWQAVLRCIDLGLRLASVESFYHTYLLSILLPGSTSKFWVAGTDEGNEGTWIWLNSHKRIASLYTYWSNGQPDNGGGGGPENCLEINRFGSLTWNDAPCSFLNNFICEL